MALLTTGDFKRVIFSSPTSVAWKALSPIPGSGFGGNALADAVSNSTAIDIYVIESSTGQFAYQGGTAYFYDDTITTVSATGSTLSVGSDLWCKVGSTVYVYGSTGTLTLVSAGDATALKAFLP